MSHTFTKLFSSITASTIWCEDSDIRVVWITMLAMCDKNGQVYASIPGLAKYAAVSVEKTGKALTKFLSPDPYSRTKDHEGRRIEEIEGGWRLLNHAKYRAIRNEEERRAYKTEKQRQYREEKRANVDNVDRSGPKKTHTDTDTNTDPLTTTMSSQNDDPAPSKIPFKKIVDLYHKLLPDLPKCEILNKTREGYIRQRWQDKKHGLPTLTHWENYFLHVSRSRFLMGQAEPQNGRKPFRANLEWLTKLSNYTKVYEDKYHE